MMTQFHIVFTLYIFGGPCHLSSVKQCSGDLSFTPQNSLFFQSWIKTNMYEFLLLSHRTGPH